MTFSAFYTEGRYDKFKVYDGDSTSDTKLLDAHSGSSLPSPLRSSGSSLLMYFRSDGSLSLSGFEAVCTAFCAAGYYLDFGTTRTCQSYVSNVCCWMCCCRPSSVCLACLHPAFLSFVSHVPHLCTCCWSGAPIKRLQAPLHAQATLATAPVPPLAIAVLLKLASAFLQIVPLVERVRQDSSKVRV